MSNSEIYNYGLSVLVIDNVQQSVRAILKAAAAKAVLASVESDISKAAAACRSGEIGLVFVSQSVCLSEPLIAERIRSFNPELPVILLAEKGDDYESSVRNIVSLLRRGITDVLFRPLKDCDVMDFLDTYLPNNPVCSIDGCGAVVGGSEEFVRTVSLAKKAAASDVPVLLAGESGTGKELLAEIIHRFSNRAGRPYITVNCAALSESLLESELFGHERGAFTGALSQRKGCFELADGGTILLDEISETPLSFQSKLLRVLEQQQFQRVGGSESVRVNIRTICTSNRDLPSLVRAGRFRLDLYYRICGVRLALPPLRSRRDDIRELIWHFVNIYGRQSGRKITRIDGSLLEKFCRYDWPGNIRQLRNAVRTLLVLGEGSTLSLIDLPYLFDQCHPADDLSASSSGNFGSLALEEIEKQAIIETLRRSENNRTAAAKILGISDRTLRDKIKKYNYSEQLQVL